jgi:PadR family transcriptional regulator PadR
MSRMPRHEEKTSGDAELLQGTLDMLILKVAALRPIHGYAIVQRLQQISKDALQIRQGSLYPALYRLENRGWLKADWKKTEGGREAKYYRLTKAGQQQLDAETAGWKRLCDAISLVLETSE